MRNQSQCQKNKVKTNVKTDACLMIAVSIILTAVLPCAASEYESVEPEGIHIESLVAQSVGMERRFQSRGLFFEEREAEEYLDEILESLASPDERRQFMLRVRVLRSGALNAFASPHGTVYVCTGLLARITSEAQAAALLAHELAHVISFHAPKTLAALKIHARANAKTRARKRPVPAFGDGAAGGISGAALWAAAGGYGRTLEREADSAGLVRMAEAGYPHGEFRSLFAMLGEYVKEEKINEPYFFSSHPHVSERLENYEQLVNTLGLADDVDCQTSLDKSRSQVNGAEISLDKSRSQVNGAENSLDKSKSQVNGAEISLDKSRSQVNDIEIPLDKSKSQVNAPEIALDKSRSQVNDPEIPLDKSKSQVNDAETSLDKSKSQVNGVGKGNCMEDDIGRGYFNIKLRNVILYDAAINLAAGRYEVAEAQLGRLLSVDSGDAAALVMRGDMERMLSPRGTEAFGWYERALSRDPDNAAALRAAGFAYHSTGDFENARRYLRRYCEVAAGAADIKMAEEALRQCGK